MDSATKDHQRQAFLAKLKENEDDVDTRLVYSDWLEENGFDDEAARQRAFPEAKEWLERLVSTGFPDDDEERELRVKYPEIKPSYGQLLALGHEAVEGYKAGKEYPGFSLGRAEDLCGDLRANRKEFWKNWSIVTGTPIPADLAEKSHFSCAC